MALLTSISKISDAVWSRTICTTVTFLVRMITLLSAVNLIVFYLNI